MTPESDALPSIYQQHTCSRCEELQPASAFYVNKRYTSGLSSYCKTCMKAYTTKWGDGNPDKLARARRSSHLKAKYGITVDDYAEMYAEQEGRCAICRDTQETRALAVDHDHSTGKVRGLLCDNCNHALGKFRDSTDRLRSAITYLEKNA